MMLPDTVAQLERGTGWRPYSIEKRIKHASVYAYNIYFPIVTAAVEVVMDWPDALEDMSDQGNRNCCVAAETTKLQNILNYLDTGKLHNYDFWKAYCKACEIDKDPATSCQADIGTFTWAGLDVLLNFGPWDIDLGGWDITQGLQEYLHILGSNVVDQSRTGINDNRLINCGFPIFQGMLADRLEYKDGVYRIPPRSKWGKQVGLHDMGLVGATDSTDCVWITNSWGRKLWPKKAGMNYRDYEWLLLEAGGEAAVMVDKDITPPPPPPEPTAHKLAVDITVDARPYHAEWSE